MPTLATFRDACAGALNDLARYQVGASTVNTTVIPFLSTPVANVSANAYDDVYLYIATGTGAGQQRVIPKGSYVPATGQVGINPAAASLAPNDFVDLTHLFPCLPAPIKADTDYRTLINRALDRISVVREITVPIATGFRLSLATWPWLRTTVRLLGVREPSPTGGSLMDSGFRRPRLVRTSFTSVLELAVPFAASGGNLTLSVAAPASSLIVASGVIAESSVGLVAETDQADVPTDQLVKAFLVEAYRDLASRSPARPNGNWGALYTAALAEAQATVPGYDVERPPAPAPPPQQAAPDDGSAQQAQAAAAAGGGR